MLAAAREVVQEVESQQYEELMEISHTLEKLAAQNSVQKSVIEPERKLDNMQGVCANGRDLCAEERERGQSLKAESVNGCDNGETVDKNACKQNAHQNVSMCDGDCRERDEASKQQANGTASEHIDGNNESYNCKSVEGAPVIFEDTTLQHIQNTVRSYSKRSKAFYGKVSTLGKLIEKVRPSPFM